MGERNLSFEIKHDPFVQIICASDDKDKNARLTRYVAWAHQVGYDEAEKTLRRMGML